MEEILRIGGIAPGLRVEVDAAAAESAGLEDDEHRLHQFVQMHRELVGIPSVLGITPVRIHTAEHAGICGHLQLMLECVTRQRRMVDLHIDLEIFIQSVLPEKTDHRCAVKIILVLRRLTGLGLDEENTLETLLPGVVLCHMQELCEVFLFALHVCVE